MSHFVIVVPESWLHQYAASVCTDCSVPASTVLSLGFPLLIIQLPFIYSLGISQSCKFGVNLYDILNIATSLFELFKLPCQQIFYLFKTLTVFSAFPMVPETVDSLSGSVWWLNESSFPVVLLLLVCSFPCWAASSLKSGKLDDLLSLWSSLFTRAQR